MARKKLLLTGATGTLGRILLPSLTQEWDVFVLSRSPKKFFSTFENKDGIVCIELDWFWNETRQKEILEDLFQKNSFYAILHFAGQVSSEGARELEFQKVNLASTKILVELSRLNGSPHFLLASSISVYGESSKDCIEDESEPREGKSLYALSKIKAEDEVLRYQMITDKGTVFRIASLYGMGTKSIVAKLKKLSKRGVILRFPKGVGKSLLHIHDLKALILSWLNSPKPGCFQLSDGNQLSLDEMSLFFGKISDRKSIQIPFYLWGYPLMVFNELLSFFGLGEFFPIKGLLKKLYVVPNNARKELGFSPKHSIQDPQSTDI